MALTAPESLLRLAQLAEADGRTPIWAGWDGEIRAVVVV
jgi:Cu+-exporting ATPase